MPERIWREWIAFYSLEPWGTEQDDGRAAMITAMIYNRHRQKNERRATLSDFMPRRGPRPKPTAQGMLDKLKQINAWMGGTFEDKRSGRND